MQNNKVTQIVTFVLALILVFGLAMWSYIGVLNNGSSNTSEDYGTTISSYIDELEAKNAYIQFDTGSDSYMYMLYNKKGEAVIELSSGGIGVYRSDNKLITLTEDTVVEISDLNPLAFLKAMVNVANSTDDCSITLENVDSDDVYTITINGKDNIKKIYDTLNDSDYTSRSIEMLETGFEDNAGISMVAEIARNNDGDFGATLSTIYKSPDTAIKDDERYYSWKFDGYLGAFDWELKEDWYTEDTSNTEAWHTLVSDTIAEVANNMQMYIDGLAKNESVGSSDTEENSNNGGITSEEN